MAEAIALSRSPLDASGTVVKALPVAGFSTSDLALPSASVRCPPISLSCQLRVWCGNDVSTFVTLPAWKACAKAKVAKTYNFVGIAGVVMLACFVVGSQSFLLHFARFCEVRSRRILFHHPFAGMDACNSKPIMQFIFIVF